MLSLHCKIQFFFVLITAGILPFGSGLSAPIRTRNISTSHIPWKQKRFSAKKHLNHQISLASSDEESSEWITLIDEPNNPHPPVKKKVLTFGQDEAAKPPLKSKVTISYVTTLAPPESIEWNEYDVVNCFLKEQQGLYEPLKSAFIEKEITGEKLFDMDNFFTDDFIQGELGIENKIQAKKLAMAVRRLKSAREEESDHSRVLDSNSEFSFNLGEGKVLKAMEMLVEGMAKGERAQMICRADYGYGKEGLRKRNGDEVVPAFADLCFEIELLDFVNV